MMINWSIYFIRNFSPYLPNKVTRFLFFKRVVHDAYNSSGTYVLHLINSFYVTKFKNVYYI